MIRDFPEARRFLLKISGEYLKGDRTHGVCWRALERIVQHLSFLQQYQWVIVVGGGNFFRGREALSECSAGIADEMGMLSTQINALALLAVIEKHGLKGALFSAREGVGEIFHVIKAQRALNQRQIVLCAGGLGHGAMSTDSAAVVRGCELDCDVILKGTQVDGVYSCDPQQYPDAVRYDVLSHEQALTQKCGVMDLAALALAAQHNKPLVVFSIAQGLNTLFQDDARYSVIGSVLT